MDQKEIEAAESLARRLLTATSAAKLTIEAVVQLIAAGIKDERARTNKALDHLQRQVNLLRIHEVGRRNRELVADAHSEEAAE
jgi:hypothetical protein